jgi:ABC transport system ATP-binding/permease protein
MKLAAITESGPNESTGKLSEELHSATIPDLLPVVAQNVSASLPATRQLQPVDHDGKPIALDRDIITIGRTKRSDVCIASPAISRDHARLLITRNSVTIIDMGSGNGCFVNAQRVNKCRLREGDVLTIGDRSYRLILGAS